MDRHMPHNIKIMVRMLMSYFTHLDAIKNKVNVLHKEDKVQYEELSQNFNSMKCILIVDINMGMDIHMDVCR